MHAACQACIHLSSLSWYFKKLITYYFFFFFLEAFALVAFSSPFFSSSSSSSSDAPYDASKNPISVESHSLLLMRAHNSKLEKIRLEISIGDDKAHRSRYHGVEETRRKGPKRPQKREEKEENAFVVFLLVVVVVSPQKCVWCVPLITQSDSKWREKNPLSNPLIFKRAY